MADGDHSQFKKVNGKYICTTCGADYSNGRRALDHKAYFKSQEKWRKDHYGR